MIWEDGFWPTWLWTLLENLVPFAAIVAFLSSLLWLWRRGPQLLVNHGWEWMTKLGHRWEAKRDKAT